MCVWGGLRYKYVNVCLPPFTARAGVHRACWGRHLCCGRWGGGVKGEGQRDRKDGGREGEGVGAYTLLTTTSSHGPSFSGTYYSAAL